MIGTLAFLFVLLPQETAESAFQKIEDALKKADTIKVEMTGSAEMKLQAREMKATFVGTLLIKGADKLKVRLKVDEDEGEPTTLDAIANGGKTKGPGAATGKAPEKLRDEILATLPRLGAAMAMQTVLDTAAGRPKQEVPKSSNLAFKGFDKGVGTLTLDVAFDGVTWNTTLEFEEKTYKLLRLTTTVVPKDPKAAGKAGVARTITEKLQIELGAEIPDAEFDLAEKK